MDVKDLIYWLKENQYMTIFNCISIYGYKRPDILTTPRSTLKEKPSFLCWPRPCQRLYLKLYNRKTLLFVGLCNLHVLSQCIALGEGTSPQSQSQTAVCWPGGNVDIGNWNSQFGSHIVLGLLSDAWEKYNNYHLRSVEEIQKKKTMMWIWLHLMQKM